MPERTQDALYREIRLDLSWSEAQLPQRERTKHVHGLHPYLGKFPPQLAEALIEAHVPRGGVVLDPFCGSGTTLVEALALGRGAVGVDISAFNALLCREKVREHPPFLPEQGLRATLARAGELADDPAFDADAPAYLERWHGASARRELLAYRAAIDPGVPWAGLARLVLTRAARSSRQVPHSDLDHARAPQREPYWCHKHRRTCTPTEGAARFLRRYTEDVLARVRAFEQVRARDVSAEVVHGDLRSASLPGDLDAVVTSPPYVGVIDYHDQHAYAYALLDLEDLRAAEIGPKAGGTSARAVAAYRTGMADALRAAARALRPGAPLCIVVNDRLELYDGILAEAGLELRSRSARHVNRRTSRRAGEYFEDVLVASA